MRASPPCSSLPSFAIALMGIALTLACGCAPQVKEEKAPPLALGSCAPYEGTPQRWVLTNPPMGTLGEVIRLNPEGTTGAASIPEIGNVPNRIRACGRFAFVVNSLSNNLKILDAPSFTVTGTITLPPGSNPMDVTFAAGKGFVSSLFHHVLYTFSVSDGSLGVSLPTGISPTPLHAYGERVFVGNTGFESQTFTYAPGTVSVYEARSFELVTTITLPCLNPQGIAGEGKEIYILCTGDYQGPGALLRLNGDTFAIEVTAPLPVIPGSFSAPGSLILGKEKILVGGFAYGVKVLSRPDLKPLGNALENQSPLWGVEDRSGRFWVALWWEKKVVVLHLDLSVDHEILIGSNAQELLFFGTP